MERSQNAPPSNMAIDHGYTDVLRWRWMIRNLNSASRVRTWRHSTQANLAIFNSTNQNVKLEKSFSRSTSSACAHWYSLTPKYTRVVKPDVVLFHSLVSLCAFSNRPGSPCPRMLLTLSKPVTASQTPMGFHHLEVQGLVIARAMLRPQQRRRNFC